MNRRNPFAAAWPYLAWTLVSAVGLAVASFVDPYVLALSCYGTAGGSAILLLVALATSRRSAAWALLGALPTVLAFVVLATYRWA